MNDEQVRQVYGTPVEKDTDWDIETMIDQVWHQLQGQVSRAAIQSVILEIISRYENARVTTYVPILVHREAVDTLRARLDEARPDRPVRDAKPDSRLEKRDDLVTAIVLPTASSGF
jgi:hypothetical protein